MMVNFPCSAFPVWPAWGGILPGRRVSWKQTESVPLLSPNESWYWLQPYWAALWKAVGTAWEFGQQTAEETEPKGVIMVGIGSPCSPLCLLAAAILNRCTILHLVPRELPPSSEEHRRHSVMWVLPHATHLGADGLDGEDFWCDGGIPEERVLVG